VSEHVGTEAATGRSAYANELLALAAVAVGLIVFGLWAPFSYQGWLMLHIFAAVVWVGGGTTVAILAFMVERERDPFLLGRFADLVGRVGMRVYTPAGLVVLIVGFVLVHKGAWGYGHFWVIFALIGWAASFLTGILVLKPQADKVAKVIPERGLDDPQAQALLKRIIMIDRWQVVLLLLVVADMAAKPFS
jgi:uncharacterized membrane protein